MKACGQRSPPPFKTSVTAAKKRRLTYAENTRFSSRGTARRRGHGRQVMADRHRMATGYRSIPAPPQLLEPDEEEAAWRLRLVLQDKQDAAALTAVRLAEDGQAYGSWPETWTPHIKERSPAGSKDCRQRLPARVLHAPAEDVLGRPLSDEAAWQFLTDDSQRSLQSGWLVLPPAWWEVASKKKPKPRAKVRSGEGENAERSSWRFLFGLDALINFDWRIAIGEATLSEAEFAELVARNERLVRFRGQWIPLDPALVAQIRQMMAGVDREEGLSFQDILHLHLLGNNDESEQTKQDSRKHRIRSGSSLRWN